MYKKTPYNTGIGINFRMKLNLTEMPMVRKIKTCVNLCSRMPKNWGFSPGAEHSDSRVRDLT